MSDLAQFEHEEQRTKYPNSEVFPNLNGRRKVEVENQDSVSNSNQKPAMATFNGTMTAKKGQES